MSSSTRNVEEQAEDVPWALSNAMAALIEETRNKADELAKMHADVKNRKKNLNDFVKAHDVFLGQVKKYDIALAREMVSRELVPSTVSYESYNDALEGAFERPLNKTERSKRLDKVERFLKSVISDMTTLSELRLRLNQDFRGQPEEEKFENTRLAVSRALAALSSLTDEDEIAKFKNKFASTIGDRLLKNIMSILNCGTRARVQVTCAAHERFERSKKRFAQQAKEGDEEDAKRMKSEE